MLEVTRSFTLLHGGVTVDELRELTRDAARALVALADALPRSDRLHEPVDAIAQLVQFRVRTDDLRSRHGLPRY